MPLRVDTEGHQDPYFQFEPGILATTLEKQGWRRGRIKGHELQSGPLESEDRRSYSCHRKGGPRDSQKDGRNMETGYDPGPNSDVRVGKGTERPR
jgi:hypothetical protein